MDTRKYILFLVLIVYTSFSRSQNINQNLIRDNLRKISASSEGFALELFKKISQAIPTNDFMICPLSVWSLLLFLTEGAKGNTLAQLQTGLRLSEDITPIRDGYKYVQEALNTNTSTVQATVTEAIVFNQQKPLNPDYVDIIQKSYRAKLIPVSFDTPVQTQEKINGIIDKATFGDIKYVVQAEDLKNMEIMLITAVFFRGQWKMPFNRSLTKTEAFYNEDGEQISTVRMMFQHGAFLYSGIPELNTHVVELPYGREDRLSMIILLPRKSTTVSNVIEKLSQMGAETIFRKLREAQEYGDEEVEVYLPKFSTSSDFVLNVILQQMGINDILNQGDANLLKMSAFNLYLTKMLHTTKIEVNEEGTVASAVTIGSLGNKASPPRFYMNRPFVYMIVEKTTNTIIFIGQVFNPNSS